MADVQHAALTGADLHEPKAVAAANAGEVYLTDGAASGTMTDIKSIGPTTVHAEIYMNGNAVETTINTTNTYEAIAGTVSEGDVDGITVTDGVMIVVTDGEYKIDASVSMIAASNNKIIQLDFGVDVGAGFVAHAQGAPRRLIATGADVGALNIQMTADLNAGDEVRLQVRNTTDNTNLTVTEVNCVMFLLHAV